MRTCDRLVMSDAEPDLVGVNRHAAYLPSVICRKPISVDRIYFRVE